MQTGNPDLHWETLRCLLDILLRERSLEWPCRLLLFDWTLQKWHQLWKPDCIGQTLLCDFFTWNLNLRAWLLSESYLVSVRTTLKTNSMLAFWVSREREKRLWTTVLVQEITRKWLFDETGDRYTQPHIEWNGFHGVCSTAMYIDLILHFRRVMFPMSSSSPSPVPPLNMSRRILNWTTSKLIVHSSGARTEEPCCAVYSRITSDVEKHDVVWRQYW
jgi:hypothetical protein